MAASAAGAALALSGCGPAWWLLGFYVPRKLFTSQTTCPEVGYGRVPPGGELLKGDSDTCEVLLGTPLARHLRGLLRGIRRISPGLSGLCTLGIVGLWL